MQEKLETVFNIEPKELLIYTKELLKSGAPIGWRGLLATLQKAYELGLEHGWSIEQDKKMQDFDDLNKTKQ